MSALDIIGLGYVPVTVDNEPIKVEDVKLRLQHLVIRETYKATCSCGTLTTYPETMYLKDARIYGGPRPPQGLIGIQITPFHRIISLHCGRCDQSQKYIKEDLLNGR